MMARTKNKKPENLGSIGSSQKTGESVLRKEKRVYDSIYYWKR